MEVQKKYLQGFVDRDVNVIFTFGNIATGKTTFIAGLLCYIHRSGPYILNQNDIDEAGYKHIIKIRDDYRDGILPQSTAKGKFQEIDVRFRPKDKDVDAMITFLDLPGETFQEDIENGKLNKELQEYLTFPNLKSTVLCFMDSSNPIKDDSFIHSFYSILRSINYDFNNVALILTKWDLVSEKHNNLYEYINSDVRQLQSVYWIKTMINNPEIFPLSVGEIDTSNSKKIKVHEYKYYKDIYEWIYLNSKVKSNKFFIFNFFKNKISWIRKIFNLENAFSDES